MDSQDSQPSDRKRKRTASPPPPDYKRKRTASPPPAPPPRKRPGASARIRAPERAAHEARIAEREREQAQQQQQRARAPAADAVAGVADHYNAVPQRGREWRSTESAIRNLRSYNNWVKSTLVHKFAPAEAEEGAGEGDARATAAARAAPLNVLDVGCGKGGDLQKWRNAPQRVGLYVGLDPAEVSVQQARGRYAEMARRDRRGALFRAEFAVQDCYGESLGGVRAVRDVGFSDEVPSRWQAGGWDVVSMMFCLHYAFESEAKARQMLRNVAGALKKGGRLIGVMPNSDVLRERLGRFRREKTATSDGAGAANGDAPTESDDKAEPPAEEKDRPADVPEWGNSIYQIRFPANTPLDGRFKPAFGWKYSYNLEEAVEELPEFVVPWEAFRALAEEYNLELQYRRPFLDVWDDDRRDAELGPLSVRMKVTDYVGGDLKLSDEEREAVGLYHAFCFYKV